MKKTILAMMILVVSPFSSMGYGFEKTPEGLFYGYQLYSEDQAAERRQPNLRLGVDTTVYGQALFLDDGLRAVIIGLRGVLSRGFSWFRPLLGIEYSLGGQIGEIGGLPFNVYGGIEFVWRFKWLSFRPQVALGLSGVVPSMQVQGDGPKNFALTHFGSLFDFRVAFQLPFNLELYTSVGFNTWNSLYSSAPLGNSLLSSNYDGVTAGIGITYQF